MDDEFSPYPSKQAQELSFSRGLGWKCHILIYFLTMQKFRKQILKNTLEWTKVRKTIGLLHKLNSILTRAALVTIFKDFIGPHLAFDNVFHESLGSSQYNACFAMWLEQLGLHRETNYIKYYAWKSSNLDVVTESFVRFIAY